MEWCGAFEGQCNDVDNNNFETFLTVVLRVDWTNNWNSMGMNLKVNATELTTAILKIFLTAVPWVDWTDSWVVMKLTTEHREIRIFPSKVECRVW